MDWDLIFEIIPYQLMMILYQTIALIMNILLIQSLNDFASKDTEELTKEWWVNLIRQDNLELQREYKIY